MLRHPVLSTFERVDPSFLQQLSPHQRSDAVKEFQQVWQQEKERVSIVLGRRKRVEHNRSRQSLEEEQKNKKVAIDLKKRMEEHAQKKSVLQLEKLKSYRKLDRSWKNKVKQISSNNQQNLSKKYQQVKKLNNQIELFWQKRHSPAHSVHFSKPKLTQPEVSPREKSQNEEHVSFLTEFRASQPQPSTNRVGNRLPSFNNSQRVKTEPKPISKTALAQHHKTDNINTCLRKSNQQWKQKEQGFFQQAMSKINKIMKARVKAVEKLKQTSCKALQNRKSREKYSIINSPRNQIKTGLSRHQKRHHSFEQRNLESQKLLMFKRKSEDEHSSSVRFRRKQLEDEGYRVRTQIFEEQRERQKRGRFHRMVRDAVNLSRLQALRQKQ